MCSMEQTSASLVAIVICAQGLNFLMPDWMCVYFMEIYSLPVMNFHKPIFSFHIVLILIHMSIQSNLIWFELLAEAKNYNSIFTTTWRKRSWFYLLSVVHYAFELKLFTRSNPCQGKHRSYGRCSQNIGNLTWVLKERLLGRLWHLYKSLNILPHVIQCKVLSEKGYELHAKTGNKCFDCYKNSTDQNGRTSAAQSNTSAIAIGSSLETYSSCQPLCGCTAQYWFWSLHSP